MEGGHRAAGPVAVPLAELPIPEGWFAVLASREVPAGRAVPARVGEDDLVVWRTTDGRCHAAGAWCPHLGAHLGHVGRVRGQQLECGFHGFTFDGAGRCLSTGYGSRGPAQARLRTWPVSEVDHLILVWRGRDQPAWWVDDRSGPGWTRPAWRTSTFPGHPVDTTENTVDIGHLRYLHGYDAVTLRSPVTFEGPVMRAAYTMRRTGRIFGIPAPSTRTEIEVTAFGLGFSHVELTIRSLDARARLWVLPTPVGSGRIHLRIGVSARRDSGPDAPPALRALPAGLASRLLRDFTLLGMASDVAQDRQVWRTKRHVVRPALAQGDGPIRPYRRWAAQFLPAPGAAGEVVAGPAG